MSGDGGDAISMTEKGDEVGQMISVRKAYTQGSRGAARKGGGEAEPCEFC